MVISAVRWADHIGHTLHPMHVLCFRVVRYVSGFAGFDVSEHAGNPPSVGRDLVRGKQTNNNPHAPPKPIRSGRGRLDPWVVQP